MAKNIPIETRLKWLPTDRWVTLNEACEIMQSPSKSYIKIYLLAHPTIDYRRVLIEDYPMMNFRDVWRWEFRRIEDTP